MPVRFKTTSPCFLVPDVQATADYYRRVLGFCPGDMIGDPPTFCMLFRDGATIVLQKGSCVPNGSDTPDAYVDVEDVQSLAAELVGGEACIVMPPTYRPIYDGWEMLVRDVDGRAILFVQAD